MTRETSSDFSRTHRTIHGFFDVLWRGHFAARRKVEIFEGSEVGDPRSVEIPVVLLEEVGLAYAAGAKSPQQVGGARALSVGDGVDAVHCGGVDVVAILANGKIHLPVRVQDLRIAGAQDRAAHGRR